DLAGVVLLDQRFVHVPEQRLRDRGAVGGGEVEAGRLGDQADRQVLVIARRTVGRRTRLGRAGAHREQRGGGEDCDRSSVNRRLHVYSSGAPTGLTSGLGLNGPLGLSSAQVPV